MKSPNLPRFAALHTAHYLRVDGDRGRMMLAFQRISPTLDDLLLLAGHFTEFLAEKEQYFRVRSIRASDSLLTTAEFSDMRTCYLEGETQRRRYVAFVLHAGFVSDNVVMMPTAFIESHPYEWQEMPLLYSALLSLYTQTLNPKTLNGSMGPAILCTTG